METKEKLSLLARALTGLKISTSQLVTIQQSGLATPQMARAIESITDAVPIASTGTNIATLRPGHYFTTTGTTAGMPTIIGDTGDYAWFLEISQYSNGDRMVVATQIASGRTYKLVIPHKTDGLSLPRVWQRLLTESLLWKGTTSPADGVKFELLDSVKNYDGIRIKYMAKNVYRESATLYAPAVVSLGLTNMTSGVPMMEFYEVDLTKTSDTVYTASHNQHVVGNFATATGTADGDVSALIVTSISGIR